MKRNLEEVEFQYAMVRAHTLQDFADLVSDSGERLPAEALDDPIDEPDEVEIEGWPI